MPVWSDILGELKQSAEARGTPDFDGIRRKYLSTVAKETGRSTILYATKWTQGGDVNPGDITIAFEDLQGLMEVVHDLPGPNLDLVLHSPGGSLDAVGAFVHYLRAKYDNVRVIVPSLAMSAATMIACAADVIVMGKHSFLGPIDPQLVLQTPLGPRMVPAQAIIAQFELAKTECRDPSMLGAWMPMLGQYGPDLLVQCKNASELAKKMAIQWLQNYMFAGEEDADSRASGIGEWLSTHDEHKSHGRPIAREELIEKGLKISLLEDNQTVQDLFLSVFHATTQTFAGTYAVKIIENNKGKAFVKQAPRGDVPAPVRQEPPERQGDLLP